MKRVHSHRKVLTQYLGPCFFIKRKPRWAFVQEWKFPAPAMLMATEVIALRAQKNDAQHRGMVNAHLLGKKRGGGSDGKLFFYPCLENKKGQSCEIQAAWSVSAADLPSA